MRAPLRPRAVRPPAHVLGHRPICVFVRLPVCGYARPSTCPPCHSSARPPACAVARLRNPKKFLCTTFINQAALSGFEFLLTTLHYAYFLNSKTTTKHTRSTVLSVKICITKNSTHKPPWMLQVDGFQQNSVLRLAALLEECMVDAWGVSTATNMSLRDFNSWLEEGAPELAPGTADDSTSHVVHEMTVFLSRRLEF